MSGGPIAVIREVRIDTQPAPSRIARWLVVVAVLSLAWIALRPHVLPQAAEAGREVVQVDLQRVGGRYLTNGVLPVRCDGR
ncbi:MAG: hypothetical protein HY216_10340 [Candidatus Rokubacteria bacterium]|nr:hypothetical protein [Candidatus Rokubacteria bacterium]